MRVDLAPAVILHRRPYRESSLLLEAFAREHGRLGLVARGARRPKARWRGLLEPLQPLRLSWSGRGELHTLTGAEAGFVRSPPAGDRLYAGFYAAELLLRMTAREDPNPELFDRFAALLETLAGEPAGPGPALRLFERDLLAALGYALPLTRESAGGAAVEPGRDYLYHPRAGVRAAGEAEPGEVAVPGAALLALAEGNLETPAQAAAARRLLAAALAPHLGGRPLRSAKTLQSLRRFSSGRRET